MIRMFLKKSDVAFVKNKLRQGCVILWLITDSRAFTEPTMTLRSNPCMKPVFPLCDECASKYNGIYDFCPKHKELFEKIESVRCKH